jgi:histidine triad (HIT) family protein
MNACIFCNIVAGEIPATVVFEDDHCLAFMDIGPIADGHLLLIPKKHYATLDDMPGDEAAQVLRHLPKLAAAARAAARAEGVNILQNNGKAAHQEVPHVHFHIIPRRHGDRWQWNWPAEPYPQGRMNELAEALRRALIS